MIRRAQPGLGTLVDITVADTLSDTRVHAAIDRAFAQVALVQRLMSFHEADSDVSRLNRAEPGAALAVHAHTLAVLQLAQRIAAACDGVFNIACAPTLVQWDLLPAPCAARPAFAPGHQVLAFDGGALVRKSAPGWIDLGGIAKGFAVDLAIEALQEAGVATACVNAGGDLRVIGEQDFPVAVRDPRDPRRAAIEITLRQQAMATSAAYFSAKPTLQGRVSALIDGRDGQTMAGAASASVTAPRCAMADALTKVVLATGQVNHRALAAFGASAFII
jgi:FAD:protein FMN transferase